MAQDQATLLVALVTLTMALTPLVVRVRTPLLCGDRGRPEPEENFSDARGSVLIIGFGRFGQLVGRCAARGLAVTTIDNDVEMIEAAARFGFRSITATAPGSTCCAPPGPGGSS